MNKQTTEAANDDSVKGNPFHFFDPEDQHAVEFFCSGGTLHLLHGISKDELELLYAIAVNYFDQKRYEEAEKHFEQLCSLCHLDFRFWYALGNVRFALKKYAKAVDAYSYLILINPDLPHAPMQAGLCYLKLDDNEKALTAFEHVQKLTENDDKYAGMHQKVSVLLKLTREKLSND